MGQSATFTPSPSARQVPPSKPNNLRATHERLDPSHNPTGAAMTQPTATSTEKGAPTTSSSIAPSNSRLTTDDGKISVAQNVVQKIAGMACREISGVYAMGTGGSRAF